MTTIKKEGPVVIKIGADWCGPCKQIAPILKELAEENEGVEFISLDADKDREEVQKHGVRGIPHIIYMKDGAVISTTTGLKDKSEIQENINLLLE
jgi:thioredoxin 1